MVAPHQSCVALLLYYLLARFCSCRATYSPSTMQKDQTFIPDCFNTVQCGPGVREGALIVHWGLCHIHLKSGPLSLLTDTLNDGRQTIQNRSLYAHKCSTFRQPLCALQPLPLLFRYLHISERCGAHKRYSQLSFSPHSVKQAHFKAFICAKPLINSAHAASLGLPLLKYWVL